MLLSLTITFIICIVGTAVIFYKVGTKSAQQASYYKGRGEGWRACEDMVIYRAVESKKIGLTEEEVLEELLQ
jgi:hypothetical protein